MAVKQLLVIALLCVAAIGCGHNPYDYRRQQVVMEKDFVPAHAESYWLPTRPPIRRTRHVPDRCRLRIGPNENEAGWITVSKAAFDEWNVGDEWITPHLSRGERNALR